MPLPSSPPDRNPRRSQAPENQRQPPRLHRQDAIVGTGEEQEQAAPPNQEHSGSEHVLELPDTVGVRAQINLLTRARPNEWRREHIVWVPRDEFYQRRRTPRPQPRVDEDPSPPSPHTNQQRPNQAATTNRDEKPSSTHSSQHRDRSPPPPYVAERGHEQPLAAPGPVRPIELPDTMGVNLLVHQIVLVDPNHPFASVVWVPTEIFYQQTPAPPYSVLPRDGEVTVELALPVPEYTPHFSEEEDFGEWEAEVWF